MKTTRVNLPVDFTGSIDGLIFYRRTPGGKIYVRKQFKFKDHPGQPKFAETQKAIYALRPSPAYKQNIKDYMQAYNQLPGNAENPLLSWTNIYNKLMFAMEKLLPGQVVLNKISRTQILAQNLPCITVKDAVEAELLPVVKGYERLNKPI